MTTRVWNKIIDDIRGSVADNLRDLANDDLFSNTDVSEEVVLFLALSYVKENAKPYL